MATKWGQGGSLSQEQSLAFCRQGTEIQRKLALTERREEGRILRIS